MIIGDVILKENFFSQVQHFSFVCLGEKKKLDASALLTFEKIPADSSVLEKVRRLESFGRNL